MTDDTRKTTSYFGQLWTVLSHAVSLTLRRPRTILLGCVVLFPVVIPLLVAFLSAAPFGKEGNTILQKLIEFGYLKALVPLVALFLASSLVTDEVEGQTIPYVLTRPMPRSAWVLGKWGAFAAVSCGMLLPATALLFFACVALGGLTLNAANIWLLLHYDAVLVAGLLSYGALCLFFGALTKHPMIIGLIVILTWQRLALALPGVMDFLTIEKYLVAMLPKLAALRENEAVRTAIAEFQRKVFLVGAVKAGITLTAMVVVFLIATVITVRWREYSAARALEA